MFIKKLRFSFFKISKTWELHVIHNHRSIRKYGQYKLNLNEGCSSFNYSTGSCKNNRVYGWGLADHGALGLKNPCSKTKSYKYLPKPVRHFFAEENKVTKIKCGYGFSAFAVKSNNLQKVYGCGINTDSQIGYHDPEKNHPLGLILAPVPIELGLKYCDTEIISMAAGRAHLVIATNKEGVFTLGSNCYGQCGRPIVEDEKYCGSSVVHNIKTLGGETINSVICGQDHTLFLSECGKVFSCGWSDDGQSGTGELGCIPCPKKVEGAINTERIVKLAGKSDCVLALNDKGDVFGWGNSEYGQIADIEGKNQLLLCPTPVTKLCGLGKITDIAAGGSICMALNECGDVFVWGYGILGIGPKVQKVKKPQKIPKQLFGCNECQPDAKVKGISCGLSHFAAVNNYNHLYTWGRNRYGCLGIGHIRDQYFPYKVSIGADVIKVSSGLDHTMAFCSG